MTPHANTNPVTVDPTDVLGPLRPAPEYPRERAMRAAGQELIQFLDDLVKRHGLSAAEVMKLSLVVADRQANLLCWAERSQT